MNLTEQIKHDIETTPIVLYMKGTKEQPQCGFSNAVVQVLNSYGVEFKDVNIFDDPEIRVRLSEYSNWPTIPQLFVSGELIGGADIVADLHSKGEMSTVLERALVTPSQ